LSLEPLVKWSGSKRSQAKSIVSLIDYDVLWKYLKETKAEWFLSFDGKAG